METLADVIDNVGRELDHALVFAMDSGRLLQLSSQLLPFFVVVIIFRPGNLFLVHLWQESLVERIEEEGELIGYDFVEAFALIGSCLGIGLKQSVDFLTISELLHMMMLKLLEMVGIPVQFQTQQLAKAIKI